MRNRAGQKEVREAKKNKKKKAIEKAVKDALEKLQRMEVRF